MTDTLQNEQIKTMAGEAFAQMEQRTRTNGDKFFCFRDDSEDRWQPLAHAIHADDDGQTMLPDDWRYRMLSEALEAIADDPEDGLDTIEAPIYDHELTGWLGSHGWRSSYCDSATDEGYIEPDAPIMRRIAAGWHYEMNMVYRAALAWLREQCEDGNA